MLTCALDDRGVIAITGADKETFLQGVISNDVALATEEQAIWSAFLTPQGKYLHDFFLVRQGERLLLETEAARLPDLLRRLKLYKLRSQVQLADVSAEWQVRALWDEGAGADKAGACNPDGVGGLAFVDPRLPAMGLRLVQPREAAAPEAETVERARWDARRIRLGLPDGSRDMEIEKALLLECGFDELGGVSWTKGCYMGQELTARTKYRGLVKKRLLPVEGLEGQPLTGTALLQEGKEVGSLRSHVGPLGLALLRLQALDKPAPITLEGQSLRVLRPDWVVLPQTEKAAS
ncbi:MAG: folate-binding protein [Pseudomonadota bacterium]